jgi:hypothetical protein
MKNLLRSIAFLGLSFAFGVAGAFAVVSQVEFTDVDYSSWYGDSVNRFAALEVLQGYEDGTYQPNKYVNRAELAVIFDRFLEKAGGDLVSGSVCIHNETIYLSGEGYFDGCNSQTCQDDGYFLGTEMGCEEYQDERNSWEQ